MTPCARLEDQCLTLLDRLSHEHERRGDLDGAGVWAQRVLEKPAKAAELSTRFVVMP